MERTRPFSSRVGRISLALLPVALAGAVLLGGGCDVFNPSAPKPPAETPPAPPSAGDATPPARSETPPLPHYPMGLRRTDLLDWAFAPDRSAMFPEDQRNTVIRDFDTGQRLRLTAEGEACDWSPDSRWILYWNRGWCFVSRDGQTNRRVTASDNTRNSRPKRAGNLPVWHPDGPALVLLDASDRLCLVSVTGDRSRQLATTEQIPIDTKSTSPEFHVGPGGEWLVYMGLNRVGFLRADGTGHRVAVRRLYRCSPPRWSADGQSVAFMADVTNADHRRIRQMWRIDLPTGDLRAVCRADPMRSEGGRYVCAFSPTGRHVAYVADDRDQPRIVLAECDSRRITKIHDQREAESLCFSPDGNRLAYVSDDQQDLVVLDLQEPRGMRLSCPGPFGRTLPTIEGWTADGRTVRLGTDRFTRWEIAADGSVARRVWPDPWEGPVEVTEFQTTRVPLEEENLTTPEKAFAEVPSAGADVEPDLETLPVQVVVEEP